ncbi:MAG: hypothetical protein E7167_05070 [Firmicutes bacterium]|nr:hypothetical protein [Bacillota bacterium]
MEKIDIRTDTQFARKVIMVAYDYITEGASYRKIAPMYDVSYVTIKSWLDNYLPKIDADLYAEVRKAAESRKEKTIDDAEVRQRVAQAVTLMVQENMTVKQIAEQLGSTEWTIYTDLVRRLPKIRELSSEYYDIVRGVLSNHSMSNSPFLKEVDNLDNEENLEGPSLR